MWIELRNFFVEGGRVGFGGFGEGREGKRGGLAHLYSTA